LIVAVGSGAALKPLAQGIDRGHNCVMVPLTGGNLHVKLGKGSLGLFGRCCGRSDRGKPRFGSGDLFAKPIKPGAVLAEREDRLGNRSEGIDCV